MTIASIDIGTNTILLLIAEIIEESQKIIPIVNVYRMPRIGQGTKATGRINTGKMTLLLEVLKEYDSIIKNHKCDKVILTGTNAFRMAKNTPEIIEFIKKHFNYDLNVVSGDIEAEFAYLGAVSNLDEFNTSMVIDIGGSSTEIIVGESNKISFKKSLQLGSVSATEQFLVHSPPLKFEIKNLRQEIKRLFSDIDKRIIPEQVVAVAGTATTLACMKLGLFEFKEDLVEKSSISIQDIKCMIEELSSLTPPGILNKNGPVMEGREDIIFAGAFILYQFMQHFGIEIIAVSTRGIRYGAIVKYFTNLN